MASTAIVLPSARLKEHAPVADPETKRRSSLYALDVANARAGILIDTGNDAGSRWLVDPSKVTARPSGEHDACLSQCFYRPRLPGAGAGWCKSVLSVATGRFSTARLAPGVPVLVPVTPMP